MDYTLAHQSHALYRKPSAIIIISNYYLSIMGL